MEYNIETEINNLRVAIAAKRAEIKAARKLRQQLEGRLELLLALREHDCAIVEKEKKE